MAHFSVVFHLDYPITRAREREIKTFLSQLTFPYALQFRLSVGAPPYHKIDVDLLDSFHASHVIFQLKEEQFYLLEQKTFADYFSSPNRFLLLDESWGRGIVPDVARMKERMLSVISRGFSRIGIAGGYSAENAGHVHQLEDYFKIPVSVDAESGLRTDGKLDLEKARAYLEFFFPQQQTRV